jgi:hypothetical protein
MRLMASRKACAWLALVFVLVVGVAWPSGSARAGDPQKAKELFRQGSVFFDTGQFARAIEVWQRAYEEKQDPGFLYNIGQAYRLAGDPRKAVFFYKSFLRNSPKSDQRQEVEGKIAALQKQIAAEDQRTGTPVTPLGAPPSAAAGAPVAPVTTPTPSTAPTTRTPAATTPPTAPTTRPPAATTPPPAATTPPIATTPPSFGPSPPITPSPARATVPSASTATTPPPPAAAASAAEPALAPPRSTAAEPNATVSPQGSPSTSGTPETLGGLAPASPSLSTTDGRVTGDVPSSPARDEQRDGADPIDFGLAPGASFWLAGPAGAKQSAFAATALLGYTFGEANHDARLRFRLGAVFQYSALREPGATDTFIDLLVDPTLRLRAWQQRLFFSADCGIGVLALAGLKPSSEFLARNQTVMVSGTQSLFEVRPALTATLRLYPAVEVFAGPALAVNPRKVHFHEPIVRLQILGGAALRF